MDTESPRETTTWQWRQQLEGSSSKPRNIRDSWCSPEAERGQGRILSTGFRGNIALLVLHFRLPASRTMRGKISVVPSLEPFFYASTRILIQPHPNYPLVSSGPHTPAVLLLPCVRSCYLGTVILSRDPLLLILMPDINITTYVWQLREVRILSLSRPSNPIPSQLLVSRK